MLEDFSFALPTEIRFGRGCIQELADVITGRDAKKPLIVTENGIIQAGLLKTATDILDAAGIGYDVFSDTVPNPRDTDCDKGAAYAKEIGADILIAIGGGSAMDTAKAIATVMTNGGTTKDWFDIELDQVSAPVICIPTTCGTGSEVTFNAVITDTSTNLKANIFDPKCGPILALVDPDTLNGLPSHLIASTGIDALTHAIEAHVNKIATPITDAVSIYAVKVINENIEKAVRNRDEKALDQMMLASMMAGIAFGNADTAAVHCIAECMGGYYDMPHGVTNAIFLAEVSEFSIPGAPEKYAAVAKNLGVDMDGITTEEAARQGIQKIRELCKRLNIPTLKSFKNVDPKDFDYLAEASAAHVCNENNPIEGRKEDYIAIFEKVYSL